MLISSWLGAIRSQFRAATSSRQRYTSRRRRQATRRRDHRAVAIAVETLEDKTLLSSQGIDVNVQEDVVQLATPGEEASFDFGTSTSVVEAGYVGVTGDDRYDAATGYGWLSGVVIGRDKGTGGDPVALTQDFNATLDGTFAVDVASGVYDVTVTTGHARKAREGVNLFLEGELRQTFSTAAGEFAVQTFTVVVDDGQLTLRIQDDDGWAVINGLVVAAQEFQVEEIVTELGEPVLDGGNLVSAPTALTIRFSPDQEIDPSSLNGIRLTRAGLDGQFGDANDVVITPGNISVGAPNEVILTFVDTIPDDRYQIAVLGSGATPLQNTSGAAFNQGVDQFVTFTVGGPAASFDFGTSTSVVEAGYVGVTGDDRYDAATGYGWLSGVVIGRDKGTGGDPVALTQDFNATLDGTFAVDVASGVYDVTVTTGHARKAREGVNLFLEGELRQTFSTAAGEFAVQTFTVVVDDGQLTLRIQDDDGWAAINAVSITAIDVPVVSADFQLEQIQSGAGDTVVNGGTLAQSPAALTLFFTPGQEIDPNSLGGITVTRAGSDGQFGNGNDVVVTPDSMWVGSSSQVGLAFMSVLPGDMYRITISGTGATPLMNLSGETYGQGTDESVTFTIGTPLPASVDFELDQISTDVGGLLVDGDVLDQAPAELEFIFAAGQIVDLATQDGITLTRAGLDGLFGDPNDVVITLGAGSLGTSDEVTIPITDLLLPNDLYQITIAGSGATPLQNTLGEDFNGGVDVTVTFTLDVRPPPSLQFTEMNSNLGGPPIQDDQILDQSPTELTFLFGSGLVINPATLNGPTDGVDDDGIQVVRAGADGVLGTADDVTITPGFIGLRDIPNDVVVRFVETLPDDLYQVTIFGTGLNTLQDSAGNIFNDGVDLVRTFELDLGAQVVAIVPQPVTRQQIIEVVDAGLVADGDTISVTVAGTQVVFELEDSNGVAGVDSGNIAIDFTSGAGGTTATAIAAAIAAEIDALLGVGAGVTTGAGGNPLITITGVSTTPTVSVAAADPAAFTASEGGLKQNDNVIVIHFNEDDLDPDSAINPDVYQLIDTKGTLDITDDDDSPATLLTSSDGVVYDSVANTVTLTYDAPIAFGTYRLRIGVSDPRSTSELAVGDGGDLNSSFDSATLFNSTQNVALGAGDLIVINSQIQSQSIALPPLAGGVDEPGHRQIPVESHVGSSGTTPVVPDAISQLSYNFQDVIGSDPQGNTLFNLISEEEKVRAREIFEIYAERLGIEFIETPSSGLLVATGDMRAVSPVITVGPGGVAGISGGPIVVMDPADTSNSTFGGSWQRVAFHEIGHSLDLGHSYDIPSVQGAGLTGEGIFTGDHDFTHLERLFRPDSTDIDLYEFDLAEDGLFTAEVFAERLTAVSLLNSALTLYRENADGSREVVARNDDYFSNDAYLELNLTAGTYFVGVTSTGNLDYDPTVSDTGSGGTTDGNYELRFSFLADPIDGDFLIDSTGTAFDGDADGIAGGVHEFFFQAGETIFVDKATASTAQDGTLDNPYSEIDVALENVTGSTDIIRIVGNGGADGDLATPEDSQTYQIGFGDDFAELEDGITFIVPQGVTVMIDQGAVFKLQNAIIDVGSSSDLIDRSQAALQILGTPDNQVVLTSNGNDAIGGDTDGVSDGANPGDWGGVVFRGDSDLEDDGVFLNYVNQADITFGGGQVLVSSVLDIYNPIHVINARPTISFNTITQSADAAISASLESFADTIDGNRDATLSRIGLDVHGNTVVNNSINGLFVAVETVFGNQIDEIDFSARFDDTDIVHVVTENIQLVGSPGGPILVGGALQARESGRLRVDASTIVKLSGARIEGERGHSNFIAEGTEEQQIIFTSIFDDRYGRSGTSDTTNDTDNSSASSGDWGGFVMNHSSNASIDQSNIAYGGGLVPIEGGFDSFNVIEVHQADLRLTNSRLDSNANGSSSSNRNGRGTNDATTIFIRGAQPIIVGNDFVANDGSVASVNANSMTPDVVRDLGRSTGVADAFTQFPSNYGPLVRLNRVGSTIALPAPTRVATELITNGGFETGDFTGWTLADTGSGNWSINDGTFDPDGPGDALPPISGNFDAITAQAGPGLHLLSESIGVPSNIQSAVLSWSDRIRNDASEFSDPNQEWRVLILDSSGNLIQEIFSTDPGDPLQQIGPNNRSFDITSLLQSLEGEQIRLSFEEQNDSGFFNVTLDDVSLQLETGSPTPAPAPSSRSNGINGIEIRAEELTVESVWDDTDIVHVLRGDISIPNFHTYGGLRLESSVDNSLVVKLSGANAGFTATGRGLDINDRIGGSLQIVGQPLNPVVLTSLSDDTIGAGLDINGLPQNDTNGDGAPPSAALAPASSSSDGHVHDDSHSHDAIDSIVVDSHTYHDSHLGDSTSDVPTINFGESLTIFGPHHTDAGHPGSPTTHFFAETGDADHFAWQDQDLSTPNVIDINYDFRDLNGVTNVITPGQITMAELALRAWENATAGAINFVRNTTAPRADVIIIGTGNLSALGGASGVGGTLGLGGGTFTHNANHTITAGSAWQDSSETWDENFNNGNPTGTFDYFTIAAQEIGHAIGLGHTTDIAGPDLMDGSYTGEQTVASVNDIAHVQVVYGVGSGGGGTGAVAQPGDWRSVRLEQFSNDRNVEVFNELEGPLLADLSDAEQNAIPPNAQFLGELAPDEEHGDENRRLGFEVYGFIAADDSGDTDVYSFNADAGSQIWIDIDRTDPTLNAVVELLDPLGNVLAQSINNTTFSGLASSLIEDTRLGGDFYTSNPNDPGMRLILPGVEDQSTTYFIRVRSNSTDLSDINGGLTTGNYQLQVRVNQFDDQPGSTIRYADIRFATNGIEILGLPGHSPLVGEAGESSAANNTRGQAQNIGNLLDSDRNTISVGGSLSSLGDVDFYQFTIDYDLVQAIGGANNGDRTFATIFDIDYADGLSRPDTTLSIFDASGNLIYVARDSNIEDDQPRQTEGVDFTDDLRGSVGELDPFIGSIQLPAGVVPAGSTNTYFVAVSQQSRLATALNGTFIGNSTNTTVRLEPVNSIQRIVEDHIGSIGYLAGSEALGFQIQVDPVSPALFDVGNTIDLNTHVTQFTLGDVQLFVHTGGSVVSVDPLTGATNYVANVGDNYGDIAMRWDGVLFGYTQGGARAGGGTYSAFDLGSNTRVNLGNSGIAANPGGRSTAFDAMAFSYSTATDNFNGPGIPSSSYAFNNFAFDVDNDGATPGNSAGLYRINADTGAARDEDVNVVGHQANINRLFYENAGLTGDITGMAFTSITGGTLLGVDDTGNLWNMFGRNIIQTNVTETGVGFTGLTNGPQNLLLDLNFDGTADSLADVFFATGTDGAMYALDASGTLVNVWDTNSDNIADSSSLSLGLGSTTGLAFSTLDFNLWHTTNNRGGNAGHGINAAPDFSRDAVDGETSFYFGMEPFVTDPSDDYRTFGQNAQFGVQSSIFQEAATNASRPAAVTSSVIGGAIRDSYNLPGGAHGSLTTNSFSLEGYDANDRPTMYFNYFIDTQGANSDDSMLDSARVFVSDDGGLNYTLLTTNNSILDQELADILSVNSEYTTNLQQQVQELHDNTGDTVGFRQARVDLGEFVGESNLTLRFDFNTAGSFNIAGDITALDPSLPGEVNTGDLNNRSRASANDFEGFYIDDIIIGFAERGEMVTNATAGLSTFFVTPDDPDSEEVTAGTYQLEIRRGTEYGVSIADAGSEIILLPIGDTNTRLTSGITLIAPAGSAIADGDVFTIFDGVHDIEFEFNNTGGVLAGRVAIGFNSTDSDFVIGNKMAAAINTVNTQFPDLVPDFAVRASSITTSNLVELSDAISSQTGATPLNLRVDLVTDSFSENGGSTTATINREGDNTLGLTVTLTAIDPNTGAPSGDVTLSSTMVTFAAGSSTSASFTITGVDNAIADGAQSAFIQATVIGFTSIGDMVDVIDDETATLILTVPTMTTVVESAAAAAGGVTDVPFSENVDIVFIGNEILNDEVVDDFAQVVFPTGASPFTFDFFGTTYTELFVNSHGLITFGSGTTAFLNDNLTGGVGGVTQAAIAPLWDNWSTSETAGPGSDAVYAAFKSDPDNPGFQQLVIRWESVPQTFGASGPVTFEAVLKNFDNSIQFNYVNLDAGDPAFDNGASATIGLKDVGVQGIDRLLVSFNNGTNPLTLIGSGQSIRVAPPTGAVVATVTRNTPTNTDLVVDLTSLDTTEASVPTTVTILAGQTSATFFISPVDDLFIDGPQVATIVASASGFLHDEDSITVLDDGDTVPIGTSTWVSQGPGATQNGQVENITPNNEVIGAIHAVVAHPTDPDIMYIAAVNGGIWRTTDATSASPDWEPLTDDLSSLSMGALEMDPGNNQVLLAGVGHVSSFAQIGGALTGLQLTTDGGNTFTEITDPLLVGRNFVAVAIRGNVLLAGANAFGGGVGEGLYRSIDLGATWSFVSGTSGLDFGATFDIAGDPSDPSRLYVSVQGRGIYRSDNFGATWTNVSQNDATLTTAISGAGIPANNNLEMSVAGNGRIFAGVVQNGQPNYIGYSDDQGVTWTQMDLPETIETTGTEGLSPRAKPDAQGQIHFSILADPNVSTTVYVAGDRQAGDLFGATGNSLGARNFTGRLFRGDTTQARGVVPSPQWESLTHGNTGGFNTEGGTVSSSAPHADSRDMVFDANNDLIEVDDGGIYRRTSPTDNTGDWFSIIGDLQVTEFHDIAYDSVSNIIIGGAQDTGTHQQIVSGGLDYNSVSTADGGDVAVDDITLAATDRSIRYSSFQNLGAFRREIYDANNGLLSTVFPNLTLVGGGSPLVPQFSTPVVLNNIDPTRLIIGGANSTYESLNQGDTITDIGGLFGVPVNGQLGQDAIAYGGSLTGVENPGVLYVGSGSDIFLRASDAAALTATNFTGGIVRDVVLDQDEWTTAYAIDSNTVYATIDAGTTWVDITGDLPDTDFRTIEFSGNLDTLYVGSRSGVFAMQTATPGFWLELGTGLPGAVVFDLEFDPTAQLLVAGTLGRGVYTIQPQASSGFDLTVDINLAAISEQTGGAAPISTTATVTRDGGTVGELVVNLSSSNLGEAVVPPTVTILDGQTSATFTVFGVSDSPVFLANGPQTVFITATAAGFNSVTDVVDVLDNETPTLFVTVTPGTVSETVGAAAATGTVFRNTPLDQDQTVFLTSNDLSEATVPTSVVILANQTSATFDIGTVNELANDGTRTVTIFATASGFEQEVIDTLNVTADSSIAGRFNRLGDSNLDREQGLLLISGNIISNVFNAGILVDSGPRDPGSNLSHPGAALNLPTLNNQALAYSTVIENNIVYNFGQTGIVFSGDPNTGNVSNAIVPFGRIVNNTIYGGETANGVGIDVTDNASPTILNNIVANTDTSISVSGNSSTTVVGTTVFQGNNSTPTTGTNAILLSLADLLFVDPLAGNFYLTAGSRAIDSSLNRLEDRPGITLVSDRLGLDPSDIFAPERDVFGQLRVDDPLQAPPPGLGFRVFTDRGAVERADFVGPTAELIVPLDNGPVDLDPDATEVFVLASLTVGKFTLLLSDIGIGLDESNIRSSQFEFRRGSTLLIDGIDYIFLFNPNTSEVTFSSNSSSFALDVYTINVENTGATPVRDLAGNAIQPNRNDGSTRFTIGLGPEISIDDVIVVEGDGPGTTEAIFIVTLSATPDSTITVDVVTSDGTATAGSDFIQLTRTVTFNPGDPLTKEVRVQIIGDTIAEIDETFFINLSNVSPNARIADAQGEGTIENDDIPSFSVNDISIVEGDIGTTVGQFEVTISGPPITDVIVFFSTADGTAVEGPDYNAATTTMLTFTPGGPLVQTVDVTVNGDTSSEGDETFFLNLTSATGNATIADAQGIATILDDEPFFTIDDFVIDPEGDPGTSTTATFTVTLSRDPGTTVTVDVETVDGTATEGSGDYQRVLLRELEFVSGQLTRTVDVTINGDTEDEFDETFMVRLTNASAGATIRDAEGVGTIVNDDNPTISINDVQVVEGDGGTTFATFTITLSTVTNEDVTVNVSTADGTATIADNDYVALSSSQVTILANEISQTFTVEIIPDSVQELDETFVVNLTNATPLTATILDGQGVGTILDDDKPDVSIDSVFILEGDDGGSNFAVFTVTLSNAGNREISINYQTRDGSAVAGSDYITVNGTKIFSVGGQLSQQILVPIIGDSIFENNEDFFVDLFGAVNALIVGVPGRAEIGNDDDDDDAPVAPATPVVAPVTAPGSFDGFTVMTDSETSGSTILTDGTELTQQTLAAGDGAVPGTGGGEVVTGSSVGIDSSLSDFAEPVVIENDDLTAEDFASDDFFAAFSQDTLEELLLGL